jgi:hypothetical protein
MVLVKNTKLQTILGKGDVMNKDRNDVIDAKFTLNGKVCGAHAADIC